MKNTLLALMAIIGLSSCSSIKQNENIRTIVVADKKIDCIGVAPMKCLKIRDTNSNEWTLFYSSIEGFNYEEGYEYIVEIKEEKKQEPIPADASSIRYILIKEITKNLVNKK